MRVEIRQSSYYRRKTANWSVQKRSASNSNLKVVWTSRLTEGLTLASYGFDWDENSISNQLKEFYITDTNVSRLTYRTVKENKYRVFKQLVVSRAEDIAFTKIKTSQTDV